MAKFCAECGAALQAGDRFCVACGSRTSTEVAPAAPVAAAAPVTVARAPDAPAPVATAPVVTAPPARPPSGVPFMRPILTALVWGGFAAAAGYLHDRTDGAVTWGLAVAVGTFVVLVALGALRALITAPFRRGSAPARAGGIGIATILLLLVTGTVVGAGTWVVGPEVPPRAFDLESISQSVIAALPLPAGEGAPLEKRVSLKDPAIGAVAAPLDADDELAARALAQLQGLGLAVSTVGIVEAPSGQRVMVVGVDAFELGPDLNAGIGALITLAQNDALPVDGVDSVAVAIHDEDGRAIFSMSASASEIEAFRSGASDRRAFIRGMALRTESRMGLIDAYRELAGR